MIVTVCGAYRNAGDYLIGDRARKLLREHVDEDIVIVDRKEIKPEHYDVFNKARAVLLTGGPAYQRGMYPTVYPIERERINVPIIPYGLGWKAPVGKTVESFEFKPEALEFIRAVHSNIEASSVRDPLTKNVLTVNGIDNVLMTGCPVWYDLEHFEDRYKFVEDSDTRSIVLSMPAKMQAGVKDLMIWLTDRFPKARKVVSFHHGVIPATDKVGRERAMDFIRFSISAMRRGWRISSLAGSLGKMEKLYAGADLHIGYRVHAHLFCLSRRKSSILINEDIRGVGQAEAFGAQVLNVNKKGDITPFTQAVDEHFSTRGQQIERSVEIMRATYPVMKQFLATL